MKLTLVIQLHRGDPLSSYPDTTVQCYKHSSVTPSQIEIDMTMRVLTWFNYV